MLEVPAELKIKLEQTITELGFLLYYIDQETIGNNQHLIIYINKPNYDTTISLDDCVLVTQKISEYIDDYINEEYILEISSSGINRKLYIPLHYQEVVGEKIFVQLNKKYSEFETKKITEILEEATEDYIKISGIKIQFKDIKKSMIVGE